MDTHRIQEDVDAAFKETVTRALTKIESNDAPEKPTLDDENRTFRTRLVAFWMLTNGALVVGIENINGWLNIDDDNISKSAIKAWEEEMTTKRNNYFAVILYSTFALAVIRLIGVHFCQSLDCVHALTVASSVPILLVQAKFVQMLP